MRKKEKSQFNFIEHCTWLSRLIQYLYPDVACTVLIESVVSAEVNMPDPKTV